MALRRQEIEKEPRHKKPKDAQPAEKLPILGTSLSNGGSISQPPGPTSPRDPRPEVRGDDGDVVDVFGGGLQDPDQRVERALKLQRAKLLSGQPNFGPCSNATATQVAGLLDRRDDREQTQRRRPGLSPLSIAQAAEALLTASENVRDHARQIVDDAVRRCGSNGQMSGSEQKWWQKFRTLFL